MNILLVDDVKNMYSYIYNIINETHKNWNVDYAESYEKALSMLNSTIYDLFILDYELDVNDATKNGVQLGLDIKSKKEYMYTPVIFETSYSEYIFDALNKLNCIYYLTKPFTNEQLIEMITKITSIPVSRRGILLHDCSGIDFYIYYDEIIYIESNGHELSISTVNELLELKRYSFKDFNENYMFKCHKSYMVNMNYVVAYDKQLSVFSVTNPKTNKTTNINVGRTFRKEAEERMKYR